MKFGAYLLAHRDDEFKDEYIDYQGLDDMIMALAEVENASINVDVGKSGYGERVTSLSTVPDESVTAKFRGRDVSEGDFFTWLEQELAKVDKFTSGQLDTLHKKVETLVERCSSTDMGERERRDSQREAKVLGDEFIRIEKFANLNYLAFHKILKKHDKQLPRTPCRRFFLMRLHQQKWIKQDYSFILSSLSKIHALLRGEVPGEVPTDEPRKTFGLGSFFGAPSSSLMEDSRNVRRYWVHYENMSSVKHQILQHLSVSHFDTSNDRVGDADLCSTIYLDNAQLELYHGMLDRVSNATEVGFRWYTTEQARLVFVEVATYKTDLQTNKTEIVKSRFTLQPYQVVPFMHGTFKSQDKAAELTALGTPSAEVDRIVRLMNDVFYMIDAKQLQPCLRSTSKRVTFGAKDSTLRINLDSHTRFQLENPREGATLLTENRWTRNPDRVLQSDELTDFPHGILEIKSKGQDQDPEWLQELIKSGYLTPVAGFTKFVHGCSALLQEDTQAMPFWIDDETIQDSLPHPATAERKGNKEGDKEVKVKAPGKKKDKVKFDNGANVMETRSASIIGVGYGSVDGTHDKQSQPFMNTRLAPSLGWARFCDGILWSSSDQYERVPLKIEPKVFLASERVYLNWLQMATTLSTIAIALIGAAAPHDVGPYAVPGIRAAHVTGMILLPLSIAFVMYAINTFYWRGKRIRLRDEEIHDDWGSYTLGTMVFIALSAILVVNLAV